MKSLTLLALAAFTSVCTAQVGNLRITEVDPAADLVEVTNLGPAFVTLTNHPFCHRLIYTSMVPSGTSFAAGEAKSFAVTGLDDVDSDIWLYRSAVFADATQLVHGVKYGPAPNIGRAGLAATVGLWPSANAFAPAPGAGQTLSYDGAGSSPHDWYVDATPSMGAPDPAPVGIVGGTHAVPFGLEQYEQVDLGHLVDAVTDWVVVDTGTVAGDFDIRVVADVNGVATPLPSAGSTRWLRVRDHDAANVQNRFYSPFQSTGTTTLPYEMSFDVNLLEVAGVGAVTRPRIILQHGTTTGGVINMWGIELQQFAADLIVLTAGGPAAQLPVGSLPAGQWAHVRIAVDFAAGTITGQIGAGPSVSLPIAPAVNVNANLMRFCFRGEGTGNTATLLVDNLTFAHGNKALEVARNSTPPNPGVLLFGQTSGPVLGQVWDPRIQASLAGNLIDALFITAPSVLSIPLPQGVVLVDPGLTLLSLVALPGQSFAVAFPPSLQLMGIGASSQGISFDAVTFELTNAIDLTLGY